MILLVVVVVGAMSVHRHMYFYSERSVTLEPG